MKKNILTIIILALGIINMILAAIIVFAVVPTTIKTNNLITKVASSIDLELESPYDNPQEQNIDIADIEVYNLPEDLTLSLKKEANDSVSHYALVSVSLSLNKKSEDYKDLQPMIEPNLSSIKEIIMDEFSKYTVNNVNDSKDKIKTDILTKLQQKFKSEFIIDVSIGKLVAE